MHRLERDVPGNSKLKSGSGFRLSSSWQGIFGNSVEPGRVLAFVRRAVSGHREASLEGDVAPEKNVQKMPLADVKKQLAIALDDCRNDVVRLRTAEQIHSATSVTELWMMRCDIYQCVAREKGQGEATRRINSLLPLFEGWVPAKQLTAVL